MKSVFFFHVNTLWKNIISFLSFCLRRQKKCYKYFHLSLSDYSFIYYYLSFYLSISVSIFPYCLFTAIHLSFYLSIFTIIFILLFFFSLSLYISIYLSIILLLCFYHHPSIIIIVFYYFYLSLYLSFYISIFYYCFYDSIYPTYLRLYLFLLLFFHTKSSILAWSGSSVLATHRHKTHHSPPESHSPLVIALCRCSFNSSYNHHLLPLCPSPSGNHTRSSGLLKAFNCITRRFNIPF